jgi:hypothetical protein
VKTTYRRPLIISLSATMIGDAACAPAAAGNPFIGDWKLSPSKTRLIDEMKVEKLADDKYGFDFQGTGMLETIVVDGTDQPGTLGTTLSVTPGGPGAWKVVRKKDGRVLITANWSLSKDGASLRDDFSTISPDGKASTVRYVYKRTAGESGFAGTWDSTSATVDFVLTIQIRPFEGDGVSIINASSLARNMKPDGKDYPNTGPNAGIVATSSLRRLDARTLEMVDKSADGKVYANQKVVVSVDDKTLSMMVRYPSRTEPNVLVFERQ